MLLSPRIEKLAFEGKCRWFVQWFGIGTEGTIQVPNGSFIVLRQILYRPFVNLNDDERNQSSNFVHQLTLNEQGSQDELQYIFRDTYTGELKGTNTQNTPICSLETIETWATFKKNVVIDLINAPDSSLFTYGATSPFLPNAQERNVPFGFGTGAIAVNPQIDLGTGIEDYHPAGEKRPIAGAIYAGAGVRDRLRFDVTAGRTITPVQPGTDNRDFQYPIVGFGMWIFNIPISEYLNY